MNDRHRRANAAVLICAYQIFVLKRTGEEAYYPFIGVNPPFIPFRDAAFCINTYPITVLDCAKAMYKAVYNCHFDYGTFNLSKFQHMAKVISLILTYSMTYFMTYSMTNSPTYSYNMATYHGLYQINSSHSLDLSLRSDKYLRVSRPWHRRSMFQY